MVGSVPSAVDRLPIPASTSREQWRQLKFDDAACHCGGIAFRATRENVE
jgi:hypothetical protein